LIKVCLSHAAKKRDIICTYGTERANAMTNKEFVNRMANGKADIIQVFLDILSKTGSRYCIIGGLAVNAYVEPVVSLDLDIVAAVEDLAAICEESKKHGMKIEQFEHSVYITSPASDLRIQLQQDPRYQEFIARATDKDVLGYPMKVAKLENVLQGKVWAYMDTSRRKSKRQKDLADILRIIGKFPQLQESLPQSLKEELGDSTLEESERDIQFIAVGKARVGIMYLAPPFLTRHLQGSELRH
jgi:hypothetical protein